MRRRPRRSRLIKSTTWPATSTTVSDVPSSAAGQTPSRTLEDSRVEGCHGSPVVKLVSDDVRVVMDLIYYKEGSAMYGYHADGEAIFDDTFRPTTALVVSDGELAVVPTVDGAVSVDVRPLRPRGARGRGPSITGRPRRRRRPHLPAHPARHRLIRGHRLVA
jgi:hypothetical protein